MASDAELVQKILDSTYKGRIDWQPTAIADQYTTAFGGKWTVTVDENVRRGTNETFWVFGLNNENGEQILRITSDEDMSIQRIYEAARRQALRVDEAIADVLKELDEPPK